MLDERLTVVVVVVVTVNGDLFVWLQKAESERVVGEYTTKR